MNILCIHCGAHHWFDERLKNGPVSSPCFSYCCHNGKVILKHLPDPPDNLRSLLTAQTTRVKRFRENIHQYNSTLAFTSFTAKEKHDNSTGGGPWVWKSGYTIYHRAGSLSKMQDNPKYAQLYFYDPAEALDYRMNRNKDLNRNIMESLQNILVQTNRYKDLFLHAFKILEHTPSRDLSIRILADPSTDLRHYNLPTLDEIAIILPGNQMDPLNPHDIILHQREGDLQFIHDQHRAYAPLHYVLLFPYGTDGWTYSLPLNANTDTTTNNNETPENEKHITQVQFYSYRLHTRQDEFPILQCGGHLYQQYICNMWVSTDQNHLRWVETHQPQLHVALFSGLEDSVIHGEGDVDCYRLLG